MEQYNLSIVGAMFGVGRSGAQSLDGDNGPRRKPVPE